jgi:hypothetical protein
VDSWTLTVRENESAGNAFLAGKNFRDFVWTRFSRHFFLIPPTPSGREGDDGKVASKTHSTKNRQKIKLQKIWSQPRNCDYVPTLV